jgi:hypothetical protein
MYYLADYYLKHHQALTSPVSIVPVLLGSFSIVLYALLFYFSEELVQMAEATRRGDKIYFPVPIALPLLFSWVHGSFAGHFWDLLGFKPRRG